MCAGTGKSVVFTALVLTKFVSTASTGTDKDTAVITPLYDRANPDANPGPRGNADWNTPRQTKHDTFLTSLLSTEIGSQRSLTSFIRGRERLFQRDSEEQRACNAAVASPMLDLWRQSYVRPCARVSPRRTEAEAYTLYGPYPEREGVRIVVRCVVLCWSLFVLCSAATILWSYF